MEKIITEPGLEHILEKIFTHLETATLFPCLSVCKYWNQVVQNPQFLLEQLRFAKMPKEIYQKWKKLALEIQDDTKLTQQFSRCLLWALKHSKIHGFLSPETVASALGLVPLLEFITTFTEINFCGEGNNNSTPLHSAAEYGHLDALKFLAKWTNNLIVENKSKTTPIHCGAISGKVTIMKFFQDMGLNLDLPDKDGCTPFHYAVTYGQLEVIKFLITVIENPFSPIINGKTAMHLAAEFGQLETLKLLVKIKDDSNLKIASSNTFLDGATPLHRAAMNGHLDCVKFLTSLGSKPDCKKSDGLTPIHLAANMGYSEIIQHFTSMMDNVNYPIGNNGFRPIHFAALNGKLEVVKILSQVKEQAGIPVSCDEHEIKGHVCKIHSSFLDITPFHLAAVGGHLNIVEYLAPMVKNKDQKKKDGYTAFASAAYFGKLEVMKFLENYHVDINIPVGQTKTTPLHFAAENGHLKVVEHIASKLRDKNVPNQNGYTPLHCAAAQGHHEIVEYLSKFVDNPNRQISNNQNITPLKTAISKNHSKVVKVLLKVLLERMDYNAHDIMSTL